MPGLSFRAFVLRRFNEILLSILGAPWALYGGEPSGGGALGTRLAAPPYPLIITLASGGISKNVTWLSRRYRQCRQGYRLLPDRGILLKSP